MIPLSQCFKCCDYSYVPPYLAKVIHFLHSFRKILHLFILVRTGACVTDMWDSEDCFQELVLSFHKVNPRNWRWVIRFGGMCFYTLSHLASPIPPNVEGHSIISDWGGIRGTGRQTKWPRQHQSPGIKLRGTPGAVSFLFWATLLPKFGGEMPSQLLRVPSQPCL